MDMLKVAFITPGAYAVPSPMGGSVERVVEKFVPLLAPHVNARIYGRRAGLPAREVWRGVTCVRYPAARKSDYFRRVCRNLRTFRPDLIEVENRPLWVPALKRLFPQTQVWLNLHSATFISPPYLGPRNRDRCLRAADRIIVNSHFLKSVVAADTPPVSSRICVNPIGVDPGCFVDRFAPDGNAFRENERRKRGWSDRLVVLYVGRLIPQKGVHHLLSALPVWAARHPDVLLVIVGGAQYGSRKISRYVRKLHAAARPWRRHVHFEPYVSHLAINRWFALADIAVVPSVGREAFGLVNVEAMASGLPVVASQAGGIKEIVEDGATGYLVSCDKRLIASELAEKVSVLLSDAEMRRTFGQCGRARVEQSFRWEQTAERWLGSARDICPTS